MVELKRDFVRIVNTIFVNTSCVNFNFCEDVDGLGLGLDSLSTIHSPMRPHLLLSCSKVSSTLQYWQWQGHYYFCNEQKVSFAILLVHHYDNNNNM